MKADVLGAMAEHYRRVISEKTRDALARLRANGRRVCRFPRPYGFRAAPGGRLETEPTEQTALAALTAFYRAQGSHCGPCRAPSKPAGSWRAMGGPVAVSTLSVLIHDRSSAPHPALTLAEPSRPEESRLPATPRVGASDGPDTRRPPR